MGPRILLAYHSEEGQTAKIGERIASVLAREGAAVDTVTTDTGPSPADYDGVIVGDSIHLGRHSRSLRRWLMHHAGALEQTPTALFQVSLTSAHDDPEHADEAHRLLQGLLEETGLDPDIVGLFAGAIAYTRYGWVKRHMMRRIAAEQGDPTDTSTDYEFTDWDAVEQFATDALAIIAGGSREPS
ncbi:MAG: hypothetical protein M5U19_11755 [Microthrixaceae bacterium]|nr:hypothetical protein [Microthrixaceae bacterium]